MIRGYYRFPLALEVLWKTTPIVNFEFSFFS